MKTYTRRIIFPEIIMYKYKNIFEMITAGDAFALERLLQMKRGIVDNEKNLQGSTPLTFAAKVSNKDMVALLLQFTKNTDNVRNALENALFRRKQKDQEIVKMLIDKFKDMNKKNKQRMLIKSKKTKLTTIFEEQKDDKQFNSKKAYERLSNTNAFEM
jgi:ankyrin repeat protein